MKHVIQYSAEDLRNLITAHLATQGYAVQAEDVTLANDVFAMVQIEFPLPVSAPGRASAGAPPSLSSPTGLTATGSSVSGPPTAPPEAPPPYRPPPHQEGLWTSQPADGQDPRYVPIDPPTGRPRVPFQRELGRNTGMVPEGKRGEPVWGYGEPRELEDVEENTGHTADFLDQYLTPRT